jgi:hypothetical protein
MKKATNTNFAVQGAVKNQTSNINTTVHVKNHEGPSMNKRSKRIRKGNCEVKMFDKSGKKHGDGTVES